MAKLGVRSSNSSRRKLKNVVEKLQRMSVLLGRNNRASSKGSVPEDVKEGHFAVIAEGQGGGGEEESPKRFVIPLSCLSNPTFLRLLEQAAEEYGFDQEGALTIPCRPSELESILARQYWQKDQTETEAARVSWSSTSCNNSTLQIY